jgi:hypothetical protein
MKLKDKMNHTSQEKIKNMKSFLVASSLVLMVPLAKGDFREGSAKSPVRGTEIGPDSEMITNDEENQPYEERLTEEEEEELKELEELEDEESQSLFDYDTPSDNNQSLEDYPED